MDRIWSKPLSKLIMLYAIVAPVQLLVLYLLDANLKIMISSLMITLASMLGTFFYLIRVTKEGGIRGSPPLKTSSVSAGRDTDVADEEDTSSPSSGNLHIAGTLAAGIAHEIRNPLTSLKGFLQLFREKEPYYTQIMLSEVDRINEIVNELLQLSNPKDEKPELKRLYPMLLNVYTLLNAEAMLRNIQLKLCMEPEMEHFAVMCRERKLKQVFINVLKNAIEAVPPKGEICISVTHSGDEAIIDIADNGSGIPEEVIDKLGQPFVTTKEGGTGLGLMMCKEIIKDHQGTMQFRNRKDGGAVVTIKLPGYSMPETYDNSFLNGRQHQ